MFYGQYTWQLTLVLVPVYFSYIYYIYIIVPGNRLPDCSQGTCTCIDAVIAPGAGRYEERTLWVGAQTVAPGHELFHL